MPAKELEQTLVLIKPDALKLSLTGYILSQFSEFHTGLRYAGIKIVHVTRMLAEAHYAEHEGKFFYPPLLEYIMGKIHYPNAPQLRRVMAIVYCGPDAVKKVRSICGPTNPHEGREKAPGTIRTLGTVVPVKDVSGKVIGERMDNLIHASSSDADAEREIKLWFKPNSMTPYMRGYPVETADAHYYYFDGKLSKNYVQGSTCLTAPGETIWGSDLDVLRAVSEGRQPAYPLRDVAAKYLVNEHPEP